MELSELRLHVQEIYSHVVNGAQSPPVITKTGSYLEYLINNRSLKQILNQRRHSDVVTPLTVAFGQSAYEFALKELLGVTEPSFAGSRVALYICSECGDPACGALTAAITFTDDEVLWANFGWQFDTFGNVRDLALYADLSFTFNRNAYQRALPKTSP